MPLVDLVGQDDGVATGSAAVQLNLTVTGLGDGAATGAAGIALTRISNLIQASRPSSGLQRLYS